MSSNSVITLDRMVGDLRTPIAAQLYQGGSAVNLAGCTVKFHMVNNAGTVIVNEQAATVDVEASGKVSYTLSALDVATAGTYWAWFIVVDGDDKEDTFPCDGRKFRIIIHPVTES